MFERFAEEARRATALASQEARQLGHDFIGTEHLLLGLLAAGEGTAFSVLTELDVTLDDARSKVSERVHGYGSASERGGGSTGAGASASTGGSVDSPPFTPLAKKTLERALREALQLEAPLIGSEHLLLGLVEVPHGGGARILAELAGNLDQVREAVLARVPPRPTAGPPLEQTKAPVTSKTLRRWATQGLTVLRAPAGHQSDPVEAVAAEPTGAIERAPRCPNCQSRLAAEARYTYLAVPRDIEPPEDEGAHETHDPNADAISVTVVYCGACGRTLGMMP